MASFLGDFVNKNGIQNGTENFFDGHKLFLDKTTYPIDQIANLKHKIPPKTIISIFGLAGVGKGTLSQKLANSLEIPNLDTGKIWRALTYIYTTLNLEINDINSDLVFEKLGVLVEENELKFQFQDKILTHTDLKNGLIDSKVSLIAKDDYTHQKFFGKCLEIYRTIENSAFVRDGRGASPKDIRLAESDGFRIVRILLDCSDNVKWKRYYQNIFINKRGNNSNIEESKEFEEKLKKEFEINILERNTRDIESQLKLGNGLITPETAVIINDNMTPQEVLETVFNYLDNIF